ncbi:MAG: hypothetical protein ACE5E4_12565 [Candidatus Binatia bacterium]
MGLSRRSSFLTTGLFVGLAFLLSCGGGEQASGVPADSAAGAAKKTRLPLEAAEGERAKVSGRIGFVGERPATPEINMRADPYCVTAAKGAKTRDSVVVAEDGALRDVFVYVSSGLEGYSFDTPEQPVVLNQQACSYTPKVLGVQVGQPFELSNGDATLHNVHSLPRNSRGFNLGMPRRGMTITRSFAKPEVLVRIKCDVHPWMESFVGVVEHPFFAVSQADGSFAIEGLPPGDYTLTAVHPKLGRLSAAVELEAGASKTVDFSFRPSGS